MSVVINSYPTYKWEASLYRCYVFNMSKDDTIKPLNNSVLDNKGVL